MLCGMPGRRSPGAAVLALACALAASAGCGGRSSLRVAGGSRPDGQGGGGGEGLGGAGGAGAAPAPCVLSSAGDPIVLVAYPEGDAGVPDLAVLAAGSAGAPARILHQAISEDANFWHPELRLVDYTIGADWPAGVVGGHPPTLAGVDAHAGGRIVPSPGAPGSVGLLWYHGDLASPNVTPGVKFRTFDAASFTGGSEHFVDEAGEVVHGLAAGRSVGAGDEGYTGDGYGATWRAWFDDVPHVTSRFTVIAANGSLALSPLDVTPAMDYPGRSVDVLWTGSRYVVATSYDTTGCAPGSTPPCTPSSVMTFELLPPGAVAASLGLRATIPVATSGLAPFRPRLARLGAATFVAWSEGAEDATGPRAVRLAALDDAGGLAGAPITLAEGSELLAPVAIGGGELGLVVTWVERGDSELAPEEPGYARLVAWHLSTTGDLDGAPVTLDVTQPEGSSLALATLVEPRALLVGWSGLPVASPVAPHVTYLARLDCGAPAP